MVSYTNGYELVLSDAADFDMRTFDDAVTRIRARASAGYDQDVAAWVDQALGLWRGSAFDDVPATPVISAEATRLEEARLQLWEMWADIRLARNAHEEVIVEHQALLAEHPVRERLWGQLMLALYHSGRRTEALKAYIEVRELLVREIGVEPGGELRRLHAQILDSTVPPAESTTKTDVRPNPANRASVLLPRQLPPDLPHFIGRQEELTGARELFRQGRARNRGTVIAISGMAGIGKTMFALHLAHQMQDRFPDGQLFVDLHSSEARPLDPAEVLQRFLRWVGVSGQDVPTEPGDRIAMYRSVLANRRMLVVLDNAASEAQVEPLLPGGHQCSVLVTSRRRLPGLAGAHHFELDLFTEEQAGELLADVIGPARTSDGPEEVRRLAALCGRHPLSLRISATRLAAKPHWTIDLLVKRLADERNRLAELEYRSTTVRAGFNLSYQGLPPGAQRLFQLLGLLRVRTFAAWLAAPLLDTSLPEAEEHVELLVENQLLQVAGRDRAGQFRYRFHDLIHLYSRELGQAHLTAHERMAATTRLLGAWLTLADRAHDTSYGANFLLNHGDFPRWPLDPSHCDSLLADPWTWWDTERESLVGFIAQAADEGAHEACWDLAVTSTTLFGTYGYLDDWQVTHDTALAATRRYANRRGEAIVLSHMGALRIYQRRYQEALGFLSQAAANLADLGDMRALALCDVGMGIAKRGQGDLRGTLWHFREAYALLSGRADPLAEAHVLLQMGQTHLALLDVGEAEGALDQARLLACSVDSGPVEGYIHYWLGMTYLSKQDYAAASGAFSRSVRLLSTTGDTRAEVSALEGLARSHLEAGEREKAGHLLLQAGAMAHEVPDSARAVRTLTEIATLMAELGDHGHALDMVNRAIGLCASVGDAETKAGLLDRLAEVQHAGGL
ncbi:BTAD domain-containing putative transcriptional regulator [Nonomuraea sp. NPDC050680]|uniref:BTAD domain-containing putative transcriptional regulator n=1 Tax=Nonomuraea sp. NPDC050680 TaxID=3154630 RepID=UPI0033CF0087